MVHVAYKGIAPALAALLGGEIDLAFLTLPQSEGAVKAGRLRMLAATGAARAEGAKGVPTLIEAGLKGFDPVFWYGVVGPAGIPRPVVERVQGELAKSFSSDAGRAELAGFGVDAVLSRPEAFEAQNRADIERWGKVAKALGLKID